MERTNQRTNRSGKGQVYDTCILVSSCLCLQGFLLIELDFVWSFVV